MLQMLSKELDKLCEENPPTPLVGAGQQGYLLQEHCKLEPEDQSRVAVADDARYAHVF